jgi:hypothetical protein
MPTERSADLFGFARVESREVVAGFDGGAITSDAGGLLLGATDRAIRLTERLAGCFIDARRPELIEHEVVTLVGQRVFGVALGYEDLNDHDQLRYDPVMAVLAGKLEARREACAPVAGKSTLNSLELSKPTPTRYKKIAHDPARIEALFVDLFLEAHDAPPKEIILDLDATDDPLHGPRRSASSTTPATATCRSTSSAATTSWPPSSGRRGRMRRRGRRTRSRASSGASASAGRVHRSSCAPTRASVARS